MMLGWEFPPYISGGLGTACFGITKALAKKGVEILFILPQIKGSERKSHVQLMSANDFQSSALPTLWKNIEFRHVDSVLRPYLDQRKYKTDFYGADRRIGKATPSNSFSLTGNYGEDLLQEALRYGQIVGGIAEAKNFDVIHGHDWMTVFAGIAAKRISRKPFIYHAHALEYDRSGENIDRNIYEIERIGMEQADHIIAVSHYTKQMIENRYGISSEKITVVHNAVNRDHPAELPFRKKRKGQKIVLFLGRITFQKGPDYFIEAAHLVLKYLPNVTFVMAGAGDMQSRMIERVAELGIGKNFHFLGFVSGIDIERIYSMSDLYVMPSISEPFGISPLEAMLRDVPVIISRQSGVAEVANTVLKVDFWDIRELAHKIISVLTYPALSREMVIRSRESLDNIHWDYAADKIISVYAHHTN